MNCHSKKKKQRTDSGKGKATVNTATSSEEFTFTTTFSGSMLACDSIHLSKVETYVYDSGMSSHMSPAHDWFIIFQAIIPNPIKAADQMLFVTTVIGELWVSILNDKSTMAIYLKGVLYCLDLAFMLILLMQCDMVGYSSLLKDC